MESTKSIHKSAKKSIDTKASKIDDQDKYCWVCHKDKINLSCNICPRSFHQKCLNNNPSYSQLDSYALLNDKDAFIKDNWVCFECELISKAESDEGKSECLKRIGRDEFCELLNFACTTIKKSADLTFHTPVNLEHYTDYTDFIVHPMDFYKIEQYIKTKKYLSTEAFLSDLKWIFHNCYIFNQATNPLTLNARYTLKVAKNEIYELETCPDCYRNIYTTSDIKDFFIRTCSHPHTLVLAKLKGHAPWPSKVVKYNNHTKEAEVRFFGLPHDKSWVTLDNCFLLSEIPSTAKVNKSQRSKLESAIKELEAHLELLEKNFPGLFKFAPPKTTLRSDQVYMIPLPDYVTTSSQPPVNHSLPSTSTSKFISTPASTPTSTKDSSIENLNLENNTEKITQPPKKQKRPTVTKTPSNKSKQIVEEPPILIEQPDFSSMNDDSDIEDKLVIDDDSANDDIKTRKLKRKREDSTSSSTKSSLVSVKSNSTNQRKSISTIDQTPQPIAKHQSQPSTPTSLPKSKKLKKSSNESIASNSPSNCSINQNSQPQNVYQNNEKIDQLVKQVQYYKNELDRSRALHIEEIKEMFENHKSEFRELKLSLDAERAKALSSLRKELEQKHTKHIEEVKRKSWCTNCLKQALFFCCRMASYCSYDCQSQHWVTHMTTCLQNKEKSSEQVAVESNQDSSIQDSLSTSKENVTADKSIEKDEINVENELLETAETPSNQQLEKSTKESTDKQSDKPIDESIDKPSNKSINKQSDVTSGKSTDKPLDEPIDKTIDKPSNKSINKQSNVPSGKSKDSPLEKSIEKSSQKSSDMKQIVSEKKEQNLVKEIKSKETKKSSGKISTRIDSNVESEEQNFVKEIKSKETRQSSLQISTKIDSNVESKEQQSKPQIEHPPIVKPKNRFLGDFKKLNENNRSSLLNSAKLKDESVKTIEVIPKEENKIDNSSLKIEEDEKMDVDVVQEKPSAEKNLNQKPEEQKVELTTKPDDDLEQMRLNLMKKLLESKKAKERILKESITKDDSNKTQTPVDSNIKMERNEDEKSPLVPDNKVTSKEPPEQIDNAKTVAEDKRLEIDNQCVVNELVENKLTDCDSVDNKKIDEKIVDKEEVEIEKDTHSKDNLKIESDEEDELRKDDIKSKNPDEPNLKEEDDDFDDDSNLVAEIFNEKKLEINDQENIKEDDKKADEVISEAVNKDQLINQIEIRENEKTTTSNYSPTHEEIKQVKDDLISKVIESELKN